MNEKVSPLVAVKKFIDKDSRPLSMNELKAFWDSCFPDQKKEYS